MQAFLASPHFHTIATAGLYSDSKTLVDLVPRRPVAEILSLYEAEVSPRFSQAFDDGTRRTILTSFLEANFHPPGSELSPAPLPSLAALFPGISAEVRAAAAADCDQDVRDLIQMADHVHALWKVLIRQTVRFNFYYILLQITLHIRLHCCNMNAYHI